MASVLSRVARAYQVRLYCTTARHRESPLSSPPKLSRLPNGLAVASIENNSSVCRVALVANAGSRFEDIDNLGITHCLRLASGLSTKKSTYFSITRTLEQAGAEFTCSSSREYMFYKVDCLRNQLDLVSKKLVQITSAPAFKPWELSDLNQHLRLDLAKLQTQPNILVYDLLHQAAFRDALGRSLYAPEHMVGKYSPEQLMHFMKSYYSTGRLALVGVGISHEELIDYSLKFNPFAAASIAHDKAKYFGGEIRQDTGGDLTYAAVAFEGPSLADSDLLHAAVLQNLMGMGPAIKYSAGTSSSPLAYAVARATSQPFAISCINVNYTDSGLFGFYVIGRPKEMEKVLHAAYKQFDKVLRRDFEEKDVARAKKQLKAQISMYREGADALIYDLGEQALGSNEILTTTDLLSFVNSINTSDITKLAKKLADRTPTMAAMGNLSYTPYIDKLV
ncbi:cytochrome b-c1 complex subunit 2, mitochondrial-like isoform X2 [Babylonia areolata]